MLNTIVHFHCGRTLSMGHAPILHGSKAPAVCIGRNAYTTEAEVAALRSNYQQMITELLLKNICVKRILKNCRKFAYEKC